MNENELEQRIRQFPLIDRSVVWIAGAHRGEQVKFFLDNYACEIWAFEPQVDAYNAMIRVIQSPRVKPYNFGLGEVTEMRAMYHTGGMGATYIEDISPAINTQLVDIWDFMNKRDYAIFNVDLFLMNVEGYEYTLLPYMIDTGCIKRFRALMIQFHHNFTSPNVYQRIRDRMLETHMLIWEYGDGLWSYWEKRVWQVL